MHDVCSAVHPMAVGSPFLRSLDLGRYGFEWRWPEVDCAHPLDDGSAGVMLRSIDATVEALGADGAAWRRVFGVPGRSFDVLSEDLFRPVLHVPRRPLRLGSIVGLWGAGAVALDLAPRRVVELAGNRLPRRVARAYRRYRHGPGAFKVDFAVEGGVPWTNEACRRAGTVHVAGPFEEVVAAEREINRGRMPERPVVLVAQQYLADPERSAGDVHPIWSYAHVPSGYDGDAEQAIVDQIERFAPGFRDRIVGSTARSTSEIAAANANYIGGDIITGANTPVQTLIRPRLSLDPYSTGIPGVYICSAATPPGAGVHGINGYNAAQSALRHLN